MKITDLVIERYRVRHQPYRWRQGLAGGSGGEGVEQLLRVTTDAGLDGLCWLGGGPLAQPIIERTLRPAFIGAEVWRREQLWRQLWELDRIESFPLAALAWLDVALWDLQAKAAGAPAWQLMGGHKARVKAYASTVTLETTDDYLRLIDQCLRRGYRAIKLHVWGEARADAALARAVRAHVGPDVELMLDGSGGYTLDESIRLGRVLEECDFLWFEEPMREYSLSAYQRLCSTLDMPILGAETCQGCHFNASEWILRGACDRLRTSWYEKGGLTGALKTASLAESFEMQTDVHGDDLASLHLACALPNSSYVEVLVPETTFGNATRHGPLYPDQHGWVTPGSAPGIGWEPDPGLRVA